MSRDRLLDPPAPADPNAPDRAVPVAPDTEPVEPDEPHPGLLAWRRNVGAPVLLDLAPPLARTPAAVDVVCWNLAIGRARFGDLLERLRAESRVLGGSDERPLVVLAQEAYRADSTVPRIATGPFHGGGAGGERHDIVALAREFGMSLRYAPSMRNGMARSDRGNAVLATCAIASMDAFSLPFLRQRRVAVAAELDGLPGLAFVSAHLENRTALSRGLRSAIGLGTSRAEQAEALGRRIIATEGGDVVLGADLNTPRGTRDAAYQSLLRAGFRSPAKIGRWHHTFHGLLRFPLDHVLFHSGRGLVRSVSVTRIDQSPGDRSWRVFGSDHHPLLAHVELDPAVTPRDRRAGAAG